MPKQDGALAPLGERRDERVVGVGDQRGVGGELGDRGSPALRDVLELAVAVELVAKQVAEARRHAAGCGA